MGENFLYRTHLKMARSARVVATTPVAIVSPRVGRATANIGARARGRAGPGEEERNARTERTGGARPRRARVANEN